MSTEVYVVMEMYTYHDTLDEVSGFNTAIVGASSDFNEAIQMRKKEMELEDTMAAEKRVYILKFNGESRETVMG